MRRVCVVGEGTAGVEAAVEATMSGAKVTLLERSSHPPIPRRLWPQLLEGEEPQLRRLHLLGSLGVEVITGMAVTSVGVGGRVDTIGARAKFDNVIIATGSRGRPVAFPGSKKGGVHVLATSTDYLELAAREGSVDRAVVSGHGVTAFQVAEKLIQNGRKVTLLARGYTGGLCRALGELLEMRASEAGVRVLGSRLQKAVGASSLEAVVAGGKVIPCDALAVVPARVPDYPAGSPEAGPGGALQVDGELRTSMPSVFAIGSCAELATSDGHLSLSLSSSAAASGRIAGANSTGRHFQLGGPGTFTARSFGLVLEGAGLTSGEAHKAGLGAAETARTQGPAWACSLVYDGSTGRLLGGQLAGPASGGMSGLLGLAVSERLGLGTLAYSDLGNSTDISLLQDTARQGLAWC